MISNTGDYGHFAGRVEGDSFALAHFDGSFVYLLTGALHGDTLRGVFHAGLRTQTPWIAVRSTGRTAPQDAHRDHHAPTPRRRSGSPFRISTGGWSPSATRGSGARWCWWTSSEAGARPATTRRRSWCASTASTTTRGLEIVGLAYEVTGDTAMDGRQVRRYRDKFGIPVSAAAGGDQRHRRRGGDAAAAPRVHVVPDDGVPRAGRPRAPGARRILRAGDGRAARADDPGVRAGDRAVAAERRDERGRRWNEDRTDRPLGSRPRAISLDARRLGLRIHRSPRYSPAIACPGTPQSSQYQPASSAVNVVRSPWPAGEPGGDHAGHRVGERLPSALRRKLLPLGHDHQAVRRGRVGVAPVPLHRPAERARRSGASPL